MSIGCSARSHSFSGPTAAAQDIPQLPQELCGIWAYIKWELAGCPERSQSDADAEYQQAIEVRATVLTMDDGCVHCAHGV